MADIVDTPVQSLEDIEQALGGSIIPRSARSHSNSHQDRRTTRQDGVVCINRLRVRAQVRNIDKDWCEVSLSVKVGEGWFRLERGHALRVARRFSGSQGTREAQELYTVAALRRSLTAHGVAVLSLEGEEQRVGDGVTDYRYWANMGSRLTYALETLADGSVAVVALN
ncbi:hypothetical protein H3N89_gp63 [Microbacterium phage MonChoix]|uniref:Uncharacterized protein n=1 Tax=Microbacterium phage MonChoix TaxID=2590880 RepID=A0A4Y6ED63_9CAUD|nr:hypothetical protein H3N89_gp63 [Microbacterium phage MonChoix]QDF16027.1 hypothetical protein SEA_MONCHOIX_63 [Microbacterium phage MonChoix]